MHENAPVIQIRQLVAAATRGLVDREVFVESVVLAAVAGEHVLVIGPPGTAKSEAVRRVSRQLGGEYFEYLLGRFTEPNEIFGPVDIRRLRDGIVEVATEGMLPEAEVAFIDEVFLGSTAILNTLLSILNERTFRRGSTQVSVPLRVCVGASNALPDDPALAAFADRFLVRVFVDNVADPQIEDLLESGWPPVSDEPQSGDGLSLIDELRNAALEVDIDGVRPVLASAVRRLRAAGVAITDRRAVRAQGLVAAAAALAGRLTATDADLWPLPVIAPTAEAQSLAREVMADLLPASRNDALPNAAEALSLGSVAIAAKLEQRGRDLLASLGDATLETDARLKIEGVLRDIDALVPAGLAAAGLTETRSALIARLNP